jgi:hypothetical protein
MGSPIKLLGIRQKAPGSKLKAESSKLKAQSSKLKAQSSKLKKFIKLNCDLPVNKKLIILFLLQLKGLSKRETRGNPRPQGEG